jgi:hypothetical protein
VQHFRSKWGKQWRTEIHQRPRAITKHHLIGLIYGCNRYYVITIDIALGWVHIRNPVNVIAASFCSNNVVMQTSFGPHSLIQLFRSKDYH